MDLEDEERGCGPLQEEIPELGNGHVHGVVAVEAGLLQHLLLLAPPLPLTAEQVDTYRINGMCKLLWSNSDFINMYTYLPTILIHM